MSDDENETPKTPQELAELAGRIERAFHHAGDLVEEFKDAGGRINMDVWDEAGEAFSIYDITGEFSLEYARVESITPSVAPDE